MFASAYKLSPITPKKYPLAPAGYPFVNYGVVYSSEKYWFHFQKGSLPYIKLTTENNIISPTEYLYSMNVYERKDVNPNASAFPIAIIAIEKRNLNHPDNKAYSFILSESNEFFSTCTVLISGKKIEIEGFNYFDFIIRENNDGKHEYIRIIDYFFSELVDILKLEKLNVKFIGSIEEALGHPETGLPKKIPDLDKEETSESKTIWIIIVLVILSLAIHQIMPSLN